MEKITDERLAEMIADAEDTGLVDNISDWYDESKLFYMLHNRTATPEADACHIANMDPPTSTAILRELLELRERVKTVERTERKRDVLKHEMVCRNNLRGQERQGFLDRISELVGRAENAEAILSQVVALLSWVRATEKNPIRLAEMAGVEYRDLEAERDELKRCVRREKEDES